MTPSSFHCDSLDGGRGGLRRPEDMSSALVPLVVNISPLVEAGRCYSPILQFIMDVIVRMTDTCPAWTTLHHRVGWGGICVFISAISSLPHANRAGMWTPSSNKAVVTHGAVQLCWFVS